MEDGTRKPGKPKPFVLMNLAGHEIKTEEVTAEKETGKDTPAVAGKGTGTTALKSVGREAGGTDGVLKEQRKKTARVGKHPENLLFALAQLGDKSMGELLVLVTRLSTMADDELLESAEGIIYLGSKYGFTYHPEFPMKANRFIAMANLTPRTKPHLSGEEKLLSYAERYPHLQVPRQYKAAIDTLACHANVPATVILRLLLDAAFDAVGLVVE